MRLAAVLTVLSPISAFAASPIDMTTPLHNLDGSVAKDTFQQQADDPKCERCGPLTLGQVVSYALFMPSDEDKGLAPDQKFARGALAMRVRDAKNAELSAEEIAVIKKCIGRSFSPLIIAETFPMLDPNAVPPKVAP